MQIKEHKSRKLRRRCLGSWVSMHPACHSLFALTAALAAICSPSLAAVVALHDVDSGLTSPTGAYRWLDVADQPYSAAYRSSYSYTQAAVQVDYGADASTLRGTLTAANLKPNFAYQLKLVGSPDSPGNEGLGLAGRWWEQQWTGSAWSSGWNLNNKGDGSSPSPNDVTYYSRRDIPDATSPTGRHYRYSAYLVLDYFITDAAGNASVDFQTGGSYHVLWKTSQLTRTPNDGPVVTSTFDASPAADAAYDAIYGLNSVGLFGEWERLPEGSISLRAGEYDVQMILTEESFHGSGGTYAGNWAAAMGASIQFNTAPEPATLAVLAIGLARFSLRKRTPKLVA